MILFEGQDYAQRQWLVQAEIGESHHISVSFLGKLKSGKTHVRKKTTWFNGAWDLAEEWIPRAPAPIPDHILRSVVDQLKQLDAAD